MKIATFSGRKARRLEQAPVVTPPAGTDVTAKAADLSRSAISDRRHTRLVTEAVDEQLARLARRTRFLAGKASRLKKGSNGRQRCDAELVALGIQVNALQAHKQEANK